MQQGGKVTRPYVKGGVGVYINLIINVKYGNKGHQSIFINTNSLNGRMDLG